MLHKIKFGIKVASLFTATTMILLVILALLLFSSNVPQSYVKSILLKQIEDKGYGITFQNLSGNLFSQVTLRDVKGYPDSENKDKLLFEIKKISVEYNIVKLLFSRAAFYEIAETIDIHNMNYYIHRDSKGKWLSLGASKKAEKQKSKRKKAKLALPYSGLVTINDLNLYYDDYKGWKKGAFPEHFSDHIEHIFGSISFQNSSIGELQLKGIMNSSKRDIEIDGFFDSKTNQFLIDFDTKDLDLSTWGNYSMPNPDYVFHAGKANVRGFITNKAYPTKNKPHFWLNISADMSDSEFKTPFFDETVSELNGNLRLLSGALSPQVLAAMKAYIPEKKHEELLRYFRMRSMINFRALLQSDSLSGFQKKPAFLTTKEHKSIRKMLENPPFVLAFNDIEGAIASINVALDGTLNTSEQWMELRVSSKGFDSELLTALYPQLYFLKPSGVSKATVNIFGKMRQPTIKGELQTDAITFGRFPIEKLQSEFTVKQAIFQIKSKNKNVPGALLSSDITINNESKTQPLTGQVYLSHIPAEQLIPKKHINSSGNVQLSLDFSGDFETVSGKATAFGTDAVFFRQAFNSAESDFLIQDKRLQLHNSQVYINDGKEALKAELQEHESLYAVQVSASELQLKDPFLSDSAAVSRLRLDGDLVIPKLANNAFDFKNTSLNIQLDLHDATVYAYDYDHLSATVNGRVTDFTVKSFKLRKEDKHLSFTGDFKNQFPSYLELYVQGMQLSDLPYLENASQYLSPVDGRLSGVIEFESRSKNNFNGTFDLYCAELYSPKISLEALDASGVFNESSLNIDRASLKHKDSRLEFTGKIQDDYSFRLDVKNNSVLKIEDLQQFASIPKKVSGKVKLDGSIQGNADNLSYNGQFKSDYLKVDTVTIRDLNLDGYFSKNNLNIKRLRSKLGEGELSFSGKFLTNNEVEYNYTTKMKNLELSDLQSLYEQSLSLLESKQRNASNNPANRSHFSIRTPDSHGDKTAIYALDDNGTVLGFLQDTLRSNKTLAKNTEINMIQGGLISGELDMKTMPQRLPSIQGNVSIKEFELPTIYVDETNIRFDQDSHGTAYQIGLKQLEFNKSPIEEVHVAGILKTDKSLHINKSTVKMNGEKLHKIISGHFAVPYKSDLSAHPIDIDIDFSKKNSAILSMFHPSVDNVYSDGDFKLDITGALESAFVTMPNSDMTSIEVLYTNRQNVAKSVIIQNPHISIDTNQLKLQNTRLRQERHSQNGSSRAIENDVTFSALFNIEQLNLLNPSSVTIDSELSVSNQKLAIDTTLLKGRLFIDDATFEGPILVAKQNGDSLEESYIKRGLDYPTLKASVELSDASIGVPNFSESKQLYPIDLDLLLSIGSDVYLSGQLVADIFGLTSDLEFQPSESPLWIQGNSNKASVSNEILISEGNLSVLNRDFEILSAQQQQLYSKQSAETIIENKVAFQSAGDTADSMAPNLSLRALTIVDNNSASTENVSSAYTHVLMTINDDLSTLKEITFEVFESDTDRPRSSNDLNYVKQYKITNESTDSESRDKREVAELFALLFPGLFSDNPNSDVLLTDIGTTQFNAFIRRSILRPFEKRLAKQVGFDDIKIDYNLGQKIIGGQDDVLGIQFIRRIISDRLLLRLNTSIDVADKEGSAKDPFELSEIELTYYLLKRRNLTLNYSNYKDDTTKLDYNSKFSMRVHHDY